MYQRMMNVLLNSLGDFGLLPKTPYGVYGSEWVRDLVICGGPNIIGSKHLMYSFIDV